MVLSQIKTDSAILQKVFSFWEEARPNLSTFPLEDYEPRTGSDGYSVTRSKPAPDIFLHAAQQLGLEPAYCVVVEDAGSGVEVALAVGMWAVGLRPVERVGAAHLVLPSLEGIHWSNLNKKLAGNRLIPC